MTGFIIAMKNEADTLLSQLDNAQSFNYIGRNFYTGSLDGEPVWAVTSGIGKVNAAVSAQFLISTFQPKRLINFGLAGGLGDINIGDIIFASSAVQYDFDLSLINNCDIGKLEEFEDKYFFLKVPKGYKSAILATGDRFNEDKKDERLIYKQLNARLRDMEGGAVAQAATMNNLPLYVFKGISDKVEKDSVKSYFENSKFALEKLKLGLKKIFKDIISNEDY